MHVGFKSLHIACGADWAWLQGSRKQQQLRALLDGQRNRGVFQSELVTPPADSSDRRLFTGLHKDV